MASLEVRLEGGGRVMANEPPDLAAPIPGRE